jgi:hypothetical protein
MVCRLLLSRNLPDRYVNDNRIKIAEYQGLKVGVADKAWYPRINTR